MAYSYANIKKWRKIQRLRVHSRLLINLHLNFMFSNLFQILFLKVMNNSLPCLTYLTWNVKWHWCSFYLSRNRVKILKKQKTIYSIRIITLLYFEETRLELNFLLIGQILKQSSWQVLCHKSFLWHFKCKRPLSIETLIVNA